MIASRPCAISSENGVQHSAHLSCMADKVDPFSDALPCTSLLQSLSLALTLLGTTGVVWLSRCISCTALRSGLGRAHGRGKPSARCFAAPYCVRAAGLCADRESGPGRASVTEGVGMSDGARGSSRTEAAPLATVQPGRPRAAAATTVSLEVERDCAEPVLLSDVAPLMLLSVARARQCHGPV